MLILDNANYLEYHFQFFQIKVKSGWVGGGGGGSSLFLQKCMCVCVCGVGGGGGGVHYHGYESILYCNQIK